MFNETELQNCNVYYSSSKKRREIKAKQNWQLPAFFQMHVALSHLKLALIFALEASKIKQ